MCCLRDVHLLCLELLRLPADDLPNGLGIH
jgi:hypothetical protein